MKKIFLALIALLFLGLFNSVTGVSAASQTITCNSTDCSSFSGPLFNETNMAPGISVSKDFTVDNSANSDDCNLVMRVARTSNFIETRDFASKLFTEIGNSSDSFFKGNFADLFTQGAVVLGVVPKSQIKTFFWSVNFDREANNDYQANNLVFNFSINFECGEALPTSIPTPAPTPTLSPAGPPMSGTGGFSSAVVGLTTFINRLPRVFGLQTEEPSTLGVVATPISEVAGSSTCLDNYYPWWIPLIIQAVIALFLIYIARKKKWSVKGIVGAGVIVAIISQIIHELLGCNCATGYWCPKYIFINLGILLVAGIIYRISLKKR